MVSHDLFEAQNICVMAWADGLRVQKEIINETTDLSRYLGSTNEDLMFDV